MPMGLEVTGIQEMQGKLKLLQQALRDDATAQATRAGASVILTAMKERAPVRVDSPTPKSTSLPPGAIRDSLRIAMGKVKDGVAMARIGPFKKIKGLVAAVEYGHRLVKGGSSRVDKYGKVRGPGRVIGHVPAHQFLRPAWDESAGPAVAAAAAKMRELIGKALQSWVP